MTLKEKNEQIEKLMMRKAKLPAGMPPITGERYSKGNVLHDEEAQIIPDRMERVKSLPGYGYLCARDFVVTVWWAENQFHGDIICHGECLTTVSAATVDELMILSSKWFHEFCAFCREASAPELLPKSYESMGSVIGPAMLYSQDDEEDADKFIFDDGVAEDLKAEESYAIISGWNMWCPTWWDREAQVYRADIMHRHMRIGNGMGATPEDLLKDIQQIVARWDAANPDA